MAFVSPGVSPALPQLTSKETQGDSAGLAFATMAALAAGMSAAAAGRRMTQMVSGESGKGEPSWLAITSARTYHRAHRHFVEAFNAATGNRCVGPDGQTDPVAVWRWQEQHGLVADGRVGPETLAAAVRQSRRRP